MTKEVKTTSCNERLCEIAGVFPLKRHHELATASPADSLLIPATSQNQLDVKREEQQIKTEKHVKDSGL